MNRLFVCFFVVGILNKRMGNFIRFNEQVLLKIYLFLERNFSNKLSNANVEYLID